MAATRSSAAPAQPPHPGVILRDRVLPGLGLSVSQAARELRVTRQTLHRILAGTVGLTPDMASRLAHFSGTPPQFWLGLQQQHDLWRVGITLADELRLIPTHTLPAAVQVDIGRFHEP